MGVSDEAEPQEWENPRTVTRAPTFAEVFAKRNSWSIDDFDAELQRSVPTLPTRPWVTESLMVSPRSSPPLEQDDLGPAGAAKLAFVPGANPEVPEFGPPRRAVTFRDVQNAAWRAVGLHGVGTLTEEPAPAGPGSGSPGPAPQSGPSTGPGQADAERPVVGTLENLTDQILRYAPKNLEHGANFMATLGALIGNEPVVIAGASLTLVKSSAEVAQAYRAGDRGGVLINSGHVVVGTLNLAALATDNERVLAATAGFLGMALGGAQQFQEARKERAERTRREDLERVPGRDSPGTVPDSSAPAPQLNRTTTGFQPKPPNRTPTQRPAARR